MELSVEILTCTWVRNNHQKRVRQQLLPSERSLRCPCHVYPLSAPTQVPQAVTPVSSQGEPCAKGWVVGMREHQCTSVWRGSWVRCPCPDERRHRESHLSRRLCPLVAERRIGGPVLEPHSLPRGASQNGSAKQGAWQRPRCEAGMRGGQGDSGPRSSPVKQWVDTMATSWGQRTEACRCLCGGRGLRGTAGKISMPFSMNVGAGSVWLSLGRH